MSETPTKPNSTNDNATEPTSASVFRRARQERSKEQTLKLSSGNVVVYKRKSIEGLMLSGVIPRDLSNKILNLQGKSNGQAKIQFEDIATTMQLQDIVLSQSLVSPKYTTGNEPAEDEITREDLEDTELVEIYNACVGVANKTVDSFRNK